MKPILLLLALLLSIPHQGFADRLTVHIGPPSSGGGGSNPLSIPPTNLADYEVVYVTAQQREWSYGVFPGIFYGTRMWLGPKFYCGLGGGLGLNVHSIGPAVYSAFGMDLGTGFGFNLEFKQALILSAIGLSSSAAVRAGVFFEF